MPDPTAALAGQLADVLYHEFGYRWINAARVARDWACLAHDRGWSSDYTIKLMCECVQVGVTTTMLRSGIRHEATLARFGVTLTRPVPVKIRGRRRRH